MLLTPPRYSDQRGFFSETWSQRHHAAPGMPGPFVRDSRSFSARHGVKGGLHVQIAPSVQGKLVRVVRGAIWGVAVAASATGWPKRRGPPVMGSTNGPPGSVR